MKKVQEKRKMTLLEEIVREIKRVDEWKKAHKWDNGHVYRQTLIRSWASEGSVDKIRRMLCIVGYLETVAPGVYEILEVPPSDLTMKQLTWRAYPDSTRMTEGCLREEWIPWWAQREYNL